MAHLLVASAVVGTAVAQQAGHQKEEYYPPMSLQVCSNSEGCIEESNSITLDANWRWVHKVDDYTNCYDDGSDPPWKSEFCPDSDSCCQNCAIDPVPQDEYSSTYGLDAMEGGYKTTLVTQNKETGMTNSGARYYMLDDATPTNYRIFKLKNKEFTFDVDVSNVGCGLNGALYFVEMDADGGMANSDKGLNKAGAKFGTGYCDAQCANDIKFIGGVANIVDWTHTSPNGTYGSCCAEMDIWEANSQSTQMTPHPCSFEGALRCEGQDCGNRADRAQSVCDMDGCDFNPYRMGNKNFFGAGADFAVDSTKPMTVVTQFLTDDGTDDGDLTEIRRFYVQDGQKIENPRVSIDGLDAYDSITAANCDAQKKLFGEPNTFKNHGGFKAISDAMGRGMVLVLSLWDDSAANMLWLDSTYLGAANETGFGAERGPCATDSGVPADIEAATPDAWTSFTNIKIGEIGSTTAPTLALV